MKDINLITIILILAFFIPLIHGAVRSFTREGIQRSFSYFLDNMEFIAGIFLSLYLTRKIFFENSSGIFKRIYEMIPSNVRALFFGRDVLTYVVVVPILLLIVLFVFRLITNPIYNRILIPISNGLYRIANALPVFFRRIVGVLIQLPRAFFIVFLLGLLLNFYTYYFYSPALAKWMNESGTYQFLYKNTIYPVLNSNLAKQIPVIVNDSFGRKGGSAAAKLVDELTGGNVRVIEYFNGVTLDEAIKSTPEIDNTAKKVVGNEKNSSKKAYLIYRWITKNVRYDYAKAEKISSDARGISSGSVVAYESRKGICFDYSSLYVSICRAVGVKVRMVTGLGYSGVIWGDHAWNQAFCSEENRWINVDTTFGTAGNYFDKPDFEVDHAQAEVQGEW